MKRTSALSKDGIVYPTFLYIGAPKAGSSWIYEILREHPEVFVPIAKDIQFFDYHYDKGIEWYLSFFKPGAGKKAVGELSHDYYLFSEAATRIKKHLPDVRLFCCLRDPIGETMSAFLQQRKETLSRDLAFGEYAFREETLRLSDYYNNLIPFYSSFPREKILVLFFDDLKNDPVEFARRIYEFLQVDADFAPQSLHHSILPASEPRSFWFAHFAYRAGLIFRKLGLANTVGRIKRNEAFAKLLYRPIEEKPKIPDETKKRLEEYFRQRYKDLPELIGQPLPAEWSLSGDILSERISR